MNKRALILALAAMLSVTAANAQPPLRSGKPIMSSAEGGLAPLEVTLAGASLPVGAAYLTQDAAYPSLFLLVRVAVPAARGLYCATMEGTYKAGGQFVFSAPVKVKPYWGKPSKMPAYGCLFPCKGSILSLWAESRETLTLASYNPETRELSKIASLPFSGLEGVYSLSAGELPDGSIEVLALVGNGGKYRKERAADESWYDGTHTYKGDISKGGVRSAIIKDILKGGSFKDVVPSDFIIAPTGALRLKHDFLGADGYLVINRFGVFGWKDSAAPGRGFARDASGKQIRYHANGPRAASIQLRSGEQVLIFGGEGSMESYTFEGMGQDGPLFSESRTVLQSKAALYTGSLAVPSAVDWDGDGAQDIICGNSEGRILFFRNTGSNAAPAFSGFAEELECEGRPLCIRPGYIGVQGPFEAIWGYSCPAVFDWNGDGLPDIVLSDSRGKLEVLLHESSGNGVLRPFALEQDGLEIKGMWRVKPAVARVGDRICVVNMDGDGALHRWWKTDENALEDGGKLKLADGSPITAHKAGTKRDGAYGRVKINLFDWDGDGDLDLILGTPAISSIPRPSAGLPDGRPILQAFLMDNIGSDAEPVFDEPKGFYVGGKDLYLGVHATAPVPCGLGDCSAGANLLVGCESGRLFWINRKDLTPFTLKDRK